jgi:hypothetical protein
MGAAARAETIPSASASSRPARCNRQTGLWEDLHVARRSDTAVVCSLRDGRRQQIAVRTLVLHEDEGLRCDGGGYPHIPIADTVHRSRRDHGTAPCRSPTDNRQGERRSPAAR